MARLESRTMKIFQRMKSEGKVTTLSREESLKLTESLGKGMQKIKERSEKLQRKSRYFAYLNESGMINYIK